MNTRSHTPVKAAAQPRTTAAQAEEQMDRAVEAIRQEWVDATQALSNIGRVVLDTCFEGDPRQVMEPTAPRAARYTELVRRVDTLGVGLSARVLAVAVRIAACDQLVRGNHWKVLDAGRKEDLLPLREPSLLAEGARFAVEMSPTRQNLQRWVANRQEELARPKKRRGISLNGARTALAHLEGLGEDATMVRVGREFQRATRPQQRKLLEQLKTVRDHLTATERRLSRMLEDG